jgi:hypothetical protein
VRRDGPVLHGRRHQGRRQQGAGGGHQDSDPARSRQRRHVPDSATCPTSSWKPRSAARRSAAPSSSAGSPRRSPRRRRRRRAGAGARRRGRPARPCRGGCATPARAARAARGCGRPSRCPAPRRPGPASSRSRRDLLGVACSSAATAASTRWRWVVSRSPRARRRSASGWSPDGRASEGGAGRARRPSYVRAKRAHVGGDAAQGHGPHGRGAIGARSSWGSAERSTTAAAPDDRRPGDARDLRHRGRAARERSALGMRRACGQAASTARSQAGCVWPRRGRRQRRHRGRAGRWRAAAHGRRPR